MGWAGGGVFFWYVRTGKAFSTSHPGDRFGLLQTLELYYYRAMRLTLKTAIHSHPIFGITNEPMTGSLIMIRDSKMQSI